MDTQIFESDLLKFNFKIKDIVKCRNNKFEI